MATLKHDRYLEDLFQEIRPQYDEVFKNVELFSSRKRKIAEIDILAIKENQCDIYEVKCSYRIIKAKRQLHKIKKLMPKTRKMFFFCGQSGALEIIL